MTLSKARMIYEFNKNPTELVRITLSEYRGKKYADVRIYYDAGQGAAADWRPGKKGLSLPVYLLNDLREGAEKAQTQVVGESGSEVLRRAVTSSVVREEPPRISPKVPLKGTQTPSTRASGALSSSAMGRKSKILPDRARIKSTGISSAPVTKIAQPPGEVVRVKKEQWLS